MKKATPRIRKAVANKLPPSGKKFSEDDLRAARLIISNGLQDALGLSQDLLGFNPGNFGTMLNQVDTLFKNNRWYLVSNFRQLLSQIYVEHGLVQTLVDVPVDDGLRGGVILKTEQLDEAEIEELRVHMEQEGDISTVGQARKWNRLFGGAGILTILEQDPEKPFDIKSIKEGDKVDFRDCDLWELFWSKQNTSDYSAVIDGPDLNKVEFYDYYGMKVHNSRVMKMIGLKAPSFIRPRLRGWGVSIVETLVNSINQYLKANNLIFEVLDEFKVDVYKIKNLANTLTSPQGTQVIQRRIQLANQQKNFQNAITMDGEDDFIQKELSFAGIAETMVGIRMQIASDMRMPLTKVFGISAAGFSSGEDDIENYNSMVESSIRSPSKFDIIKIAKIRCAQIFGFVPDDLTCEFKPLRVLTSEQEENVKNAKFSRLFQAVSSGHCTEKEFKQGCNKDNLLPVQLDENVDKIDVMPDENVEDTNTPAGPKSTKTPKPAKNSLDVKNRVAVVGLICGDSILTGQRKDSGLWVFPGGGSEGQEMIEMTAVRETLEEAGIGIMPSKLIPYPAKIVKSDIGTYEITPFLYELPQMIYARTILDPDTEVHNWRWVPISSKTQELQKENRHHDNDVILEHLKERMK